MTPTRRRVGLAALAVCVLGAGGVAADPYALRGDALVQTQRPSGVLILDGHGAVTPEVGVEVYLWGAVGGEPNPEADLLVAALSYVDAKGRGELRAGRLLITSGGLRPLHLDGLTALGRLRTHTSLQLFGGLPTAPRFSTRAWDWAAGGRIAQEWGLSTFGVGYLQQREAGQLAFHELALDAAIFPLDGFDLGARGALDLISTALAELVVNTSVRVGAVRATLSAIHRSPSHLLPATSLFTVLGDRASRSLTAQVEWRAAPRLDLTLGGGARALDDQPYEDLSLRARLRLARDPAGGSVGVEVRRQGAPGGGWTGARLFARVPLPYALAASAEAELVRPDTPGTRGELWPWALVALSWYPTPSWELAAAAEAAVTPEAVHRVDALLRASYLWSNP